MPSSSLKLLEKQINIKAHGLSQRFRSSNLLIMKMAIL